MQNAPPAPADEEVQPQPLADQDATDHTAVKVRRPNHELPGQYIKTTVCNVPHMASRPNASKRIQLLVEFSTTERSLIQKACTYFRTYFGFAHVSPSSTRQVNHEKQAANWWEKDHSEAAPAEDDQHVAAIQNAPEPAAPIEEAAVPIVEAAPLPAAIGDAAAPAEEEVQKVSQTDVEATWNKEPARQEKEPVESKPWWENDSTSAAPFVEKVEGEEEAAVDPFTAGKQQPAEVPEEEEAPAAFAHNNNNNKVKPLVPHHSSVNQPVANNNNNANDEE